MNRSASKASRGLHVTLGLFGWLAVLLVGCGSDAGHSPAPRQGQGTITLTFAQAPMYGTTLSDGEFEYVGVISAPAGLHPDEPLVLLVEDQSGLRSEVNLKEFIAANSTELQNTMLDESTGVFVIDGINDLYIDEGTKSLQLIAKDADEDIASHFSLNYVGSLISPTGAEFNSARRRWTANILSMVGAYSNLLNQLEFEGAFEDFAELDRKLLLAQLTHLTFRGTQANTVGWGTSGSELEGDVAAILGEFPTSDQDELDWREAYTRSIGWERYFCERWESVADFVQIRGRFQVGSGDQRLARYTFHANAQSQTSVTEVTDGFEFDARIFFDEGVPAFCTGWPEDYDPESIEDNTADPDDPAWQLVVRFLDTNDNDVIDDIEVEGFGVDPATGEPVDFTDTSNLGGHSMAPLRYLYESCYLQGFGG